jgi:hypothetical protein
MNSAGWLKPLRTIVLIIAFLAAGPALFAHPKDVTYTTLNLAPEAINGEIFINGYQVARLAQQFNLDPSQLSQDALKNLIRAYFDDHFLITGKSGDLQKQVIDIKNADPSAFLSSGLSLIFYVKLQPNDYPVTFETNMFFEFFTTQTNKLALRDKLGRPYPGDRDALITTHLATFTFDPARPDFSRYDFDGFDSDGDGIADQYEALYGLDPFNPDSDGDGFSDFEEFFMGWDPFNTTLAEGQTHDAYREAIAAFAAQYRRKPTETSLLLSYNEETLLKEEGVASGAENESPTVAKMLKVQGLDARASAENGLLALILGRMEESLYQTFNFGNFLVLLGLAAGLGFFHAGASGPGKGLLAGYAAKDGREARPTLIFAAAVTGGQLGSVILEAILFRLIFTRLFRSLPLITYLIQAAAGVALAAIAVVLILAAVRRIRVGMVIGEKTFFDGTYGAVLLGGLTGLGAAPYFWSVFQFCAEIERAYLIPFFTIAYGAGLLVCLGLVALAVLVVRHVVPDILPKLTLYAELVSASLMLLFALFFFFIRSPI